MLSNNSQNEKLLQDERQGKMLLHTEFSLLSLLNNQSGVIQQHGMFSVSWHLIDHAVGNYKINANLYSLNPK